MVHMQIMLRLCTLFTRRLSHLLFWTTSRDVCCAWGTAKFHHTCRHFFSVSISESIGSTGCSAGISACKSTHGFWYHTFYSKLERYVRLHSGMPIFRLGGWSKVESHNPRKIWMGCRISWTGMPKMGGADFSSKPKHLSRLEWKIWSIDVKLYSNEKLSQYKSSRIWMKNTYQVVLEWKIRSLHAIVCSLFSSWSGNKTTSKPSCIFMAAV